MYKVAHGSFKDSTRVLFHINKRRQYKDLIHSVSPRSLYYVDNEWLALHPEVATTAFGDNDESKIGDVLQKKLDSIGIRKTYGCSCRSIAVLMNSAPINSISSNKKYFVDEILENRVIRKRIKLHIRWKRIKKELLEIAQDFMPAIVARIAVGFLIRVALRIEKRRLRN